MINKIKMKYCGLSLPAKATLWFVLCSIVQKGIAFFTTPIFTRILSTKDYGTLSVYNSWLEIVAVFATLQLPTGVYNKAMIKFQNDRDGYTSSSLTLASLITASFFLLYLIQTDNWNHMFGLNTPIMVMMFADIFFSTAMSFWSIRHRFEYKYKSVITFTLLANILGSVLSILLVLNHPTLKAEYKILGTLLIRICLYSILYGWILLRGKKLCVLGYWKYSVSYNLPLIPHYLSQQVLNQSDRIMISNLCGESKAGIYSVAYQIAMVMNLITYSIHTSFMPWTFECMRDKKYKKIGKTALQIEIVVGICCFGFSLFAPEMISILGGYEYQSAIWIVPPVAMSVFFQTLYSFYGNIEFYFESTKFVMLASIIVACANVVLNFICIPVFGFIAAGYTTLICYFLYSGAHYLFMRYICAKNGISSPYQDKKMWLVAAGCSVLSIVASFLYGFFVFRYLVILFIFAFLGLIIKKKFIK